jgi:deazaflavin-dependent oxidoreductase (nitroreductase family)
MQTRNAQIIDEFRANDGVAISFFGGAPMAILHTIGAKSGIERENPMLCLELDGRRYVFASNGGKDVHPGWYHNLIANPTVEVEYKTDRYSTTATPLSDPERARVYAVVGEQYPIFAQYAAGTERVIPVVDVTPV